MMSFSRFFALILAPFFLLAPLHSVQSAPLLPQPALPDSPAKTADYLLGPQDVLSVTVLNHPELSVEQVSVTDGGRIQVPVAGEVLAAGRTLGQVQATISAAMKAWLLRPNVTVSLRQARPRLSVTAYVDGFVRNPGLVQLDEGAGVVQAIAQSGGLTVPFDNSKVVASVRRGQQIIKVDLERLAFDPNANVPLKRGDVILLAEPPIMRVQITGPVSKPGELRLAPGATVIEAIANAGNLTAGRDLVAVSILRTLPNGTRAALQLDPQKLFTLRDLGQNVVLQDGDLISISQRQDQTVFIGGEVVKSGSYEFKEGDDISDLIARAGGPTEWAKLGKATLTRRDGTSQMVDVGPAIRAGGAKIGVPLSEGDYLVVPRNQDRVLVMQAVNKPGYFPVPEERPLTLGEALGLAGGPKDRARLKEITVLRETPNGVQRTSLSLDDPKNKRLATNFVLQNGDVIFVPDGKLRSSTSSQILGAGISILGRLF